MVATRVEDMKDQENGPGKKKQQLFYQNVDKACMLSHEKNQNIRKLDAIFTSQIFGTQIKYWFYPFSVDHYALQAFVFINENNSYLNQMSRLTDWE